MTLSEKLSVLFILSLLSCQMGSDEPSDGQNPPLMDKTFVFDEAFNKAVPDLIMQKGALQPDGKLVVVGEDIIRLNPDGTLDPSFDSPEISDKLYVNGGQDVVLQPDGKILVAGGYNFVQGEERGIFRMNSDGSIDHGFYFDFDPDPRFRPWINDIYLQDGGKIIIGGGFNYFHRVESRFYRNILRLNSDGSVDTSFKCDISLGDVTEIHVLSDDKLLVVGNFFIETNSIGSIDALKVDKNNGTIDWSFKQPYIGETGFGKSGFGTAAVLDDGKIIVGGSFKTTGVTDIARLNSDGSIDESFKSDQNEQKGSIISIHPLSNGKFLIGRDTFGNLNEDQDPLTIVDASGKDEEYELGFTAHGITQILPVGNNKYIIFRDFQNIKTNVRHRIMRVNVQ